MKTLLRIFLLPMILAANTAWAFEPDTNDKMELDVKRAILQIKQKSPGMQAYFDQSAGYAVYPSVGKGGWIIGGAYGNGLVIVNDKVDGYTTLTQVTIGAQIGGQRYAQFIFFRDQIALDHFKRGNFEFGAQASAVAITAAASVDADYDGGVAIFTDAGGGLMAEATVGGQSFSYQPKYKD